MSTTGNASKVTGNASTEQRLDVDVSDILFHTGEPSDTPIIALKGGKLYLGGGATPKDVPGRIKSEIANEVDYKIIEKDPLARTAQASSAVASTSEETIPVDSQTSVYVGDLLVNKRTGEVMYCHTRTSATSLECKRNLGSTSYEIADDDVFYVSSYATKQAGSKRGMNSQLAAPRTRYCQIFKRSFGVSDTLLNVLLVTQKSEWDEEMTQAMVNHKIDIENALWYGPGADSTTDADSNTVYLTRGILNEIGADRTIDCKGAMDEATFFGEVAEKVFEYGPSRKMLFADAKFLTRLNDFSRVKQQTKPKMTDYGVSVAEVETGHGILDVVRCGVFNKHVEVSAQGFAVALDLDAIAYKHIKNRDSKYQVDIQTPGDDAREGQFITEAGVSVRLLDHHKIIKNI